MNKTPPSIHFLITGGTIDSRDKDIPYPLNPSEKSILPSYIKNLKLKNKFKFTAICSKDSRDLSKNDIKKIFNETSKSKSKYIIITSGTYAIPDIARFLSANLKQNNKTIILTGAMLPIYGFAMSDGAFNLGFAIAKIGDLSNGVYVCMNGKFFHSNEVVKVVKEGRFDSVFLK